MLHVLSLFMAVHVSRQPKVALVSLKVLIQAILGFSLTLVRSTYRQWYEDYYGASLLNDVEGSATFVFTITWLCCP